MTRRQMLGAVLVASGLAAVVFVGVAVTELSYVGSHPYRYGPAKVIAWAAAAGALLSAAVALLAHSLRASEQTRS